MGVDPAAFVATIEQYNTAVDTGVDELGRTILTKKIEVAPFYAALRSVTVHHTMGGVEINAQAQVIDTNGQVIPCLYAAGEVTGGIHGLQPSWAAMPWPIPWVFGRIAGSNVVS